MRFDNDRVRKVCDRAVYYLNAEEALVAGMNLVLEALELYSMGEELPMGPGDLEMLTEVSEKFETFLTS